MGPMAGQLVLVIVVAAGIVIAAAIYWRTAKALHRGAARGGRDPEHLDSPAADSPEKPASADQPLLTADSAARVSPGDAAHNSASRSFAPTLAPTAAAGTGADLGLGSSASAPQSQTTPTKPVCDDPSELEFTIEGLPAPAPAPKSAAAAEAPAADGGPTAPAGNAASAPRGSTGTTASTSPRPAAPAASAPPTHPGAVEPPEVFAKLFDLALGKARPASTVTSGHDNVAAATAAALEDVATQQRYAPRRPNMLPKILSASSDDSFSRRELAALIARDPSLVGNLLKIANSSYYRLTPEPVESVDRAVVLLGTDGIRSLVTAALMQPIFRIGGADFPRFPEIAWEHTFRSASAAVPYNFMVEKSDPFAAELLSLVMGLAEIVVFRVTMDQYAKNSRLRPDAGIVSALLDMHSATVARRIGASWELSEATLAGLDGQEANTTTYPSALGRSLYFGRVVGALAVLRINRVIDDAIGKASIPRNNMPEAQIDRMWTKLTLRLEKH
jgi:HDOD domain